MTSVYFFVLFVRILGSGLPEVEIPGDHETHEACAAKAVEVDNSTPLTLVMRCQRFTRV